MGEFVLRSNKINDATQTKHQGSKEDRIDRDFFNAPLRENMC